MLILDSRPMVNRRQNLGHTESKDFSSSGNNGRYVTLIAPFLIILTSNFAKLKTP